VDETAEFRRIPKLERFYSKI